MLLTALKRKPCPVKQREAQVPFCTTAHLIHCSGQVAFQHKFPPRSRQLCPPTQRTILSHKQGTHILLSASIKSPGFSGVGEAGAAASGCPLTGKQLSFACKASLQVHVVGRVSHLILHLLRPCRFVLFYAFSRRPSVWTNWAPGSLLWDCPSGVSRIRLICCTKEPCLVHVKDSTYLAC